MENNNGKGIFYGVIGVATLVVAIIGATFAFFSATANVAGANEAAANSVNLADTLAITGTAQFGTEMIPVEAVEMYKSYNISGANHCKGYSATSIVDGTPMDDAPLYDLCSTYDFTITNSATVAQTVYFTFAATTNTFGANGNLMYCIYRQGQVADGGDGELVDCKKVPVEGTPDTNVFNDIIPAKVDSTNGSKSYTMVLYIAEAGEQTAVDAGKAFAGSITASTAGGASKVTGVVSTLSA